MSEEDDPRLTLVVGERSVGAHLDQAIKAGKVLRREDGRLALAARASESEVNDLVGNFLPKLGTCRLPCSFLNEFLFENAYGRAAVPFGCRDCFKIRISSKSLAQLMAVREIAEATGQSTKSGTELDSKKSPHIYNSYIYYGSLDEARRAYPGVKDSIIRHERLGPDVQVIIKRGCTNYERKLGPADQYTFDPALEAVEAYLMERFEGGVLPKADDKRANAKRMLYLIETAFRVGDETYKEFTGGKPLYPPLMNFALEDDQA